MAGQSFWLPFCLPIPVGTFVGIALVCLSAYYVTLRVPEATLSHPFRRKEHLSSLNHAYSCIVRVLVFFPFVIIALDDAFQPFNLLTYLYLRRHSPGAGWAGITNWTDHVSNRGTPGSTVLCELTRDFHPVIAPSCVADDSQSGGGFRSALIVVAHVFSWHPIRLLRPEFSRFAIFHK